MIDDKKLEELVYKLICDMPGISISELVELTGIDTMKILKIVENLKRKGKIWAAEWKDLTEFIEVKWE